jgi:hypothetical protein
VEERKIERERGTATATATATPRRTREGESGRERGSVCVWKIERKRGKASLRHCVIGKGKLTAQHKIYVHINASFPNFFPLSANIVTIGTLKKNRNKTLTSK